MHIRYHSHFNTVVMMENFIECWNSFILERMVIVVFHRRTFFELFQSSGLFDFTIIPNVVGPKYGAYLVKANFKSHWAYSVIYTAYKPECILNHLLNYDLKPGTQKHLDNLLKAL